MSLLRTRRKLVCFYCNKKSNILYDGLITQWECANCDAHNYLDERGEITDPPVATEKVASSKSTYAVPKPQYDFLPSSQEADTFVFCPTCQKNQHLYRASLAQYYVETDPYHPEYRRLEKEYYRYKKDLEKRYPQVCEQCAPKALERMTHAKKTAQSDWLKRQLEKSQSGILRPRPRSVSFSNIYKLVWLTGVMGHLIWDAMSLIATVLYNDTEIISNLKLTPKFSRPLESAISLTTSEKWLWRSLLCSFFAFGWNPRFKEVMAHNNRLHTLITGYRYWYKFQMIMLVARCLIYYSVGKSVFADPFGPAATGAHIFSFGFIVLLSIRSQKALKVDHSPLWRSDQGFAFVGPASSPSSQTIPGDGTLEDILNEISALPPKRSSPPTSPPRISSASPRWEDSPTHLSSPSLRRPRKELISMNGSDVSSTKVIPNETSQYLENEILPQRLQTQDDPNEMDWSPILPQAQPRAFITSQPPQASYQSQLLGQSPVSGKSPVFWAKVPPAPVTPAHKLRNPPNQPRIRAASQEQKENFFNSMTRRSPGQQGKLTGEHSDREIQFSQQKFFPPSPPNEEEDALARAFGGFSLRDEAVIAPQDPRRIPLGSLLSLALVAGFVYMTLTVMSYNKSDTHVGSENLKAGPS